MGNVMLPCCHVALLPCCHKDAYLCYCIRLSSRWSRVSYSSILE